MIGKLEEAWDAGNGNRKVLRVGIPKGMSVSIKGDNLIGTDKEGGVISIPLPKPAFMWQLLCVSSKGGYDEAVLVESR